MAGQRGLGMKLLVAIIGLVPMAVLGFPPPLSPLEQDRNPGRSPISPLLPPVKTIWPPSLADGSIGRSPSSTPQSNKPGSPSAAVQSVRPPQDKVAVPPGSVLVICKEIKDALKLIPEGILLAPEKYQALLDQIDALEAQTKKTKPEIPTSCKLSGQMEGDQIQLEARFEFRTEKPRTVVALGCRRAWPKPGAVLDGQLPLLSWDDEGLSVRVEKPGVHLLVVGLELPLTSKNPSGGEQGFDVGLPRAAITTLDQFTLNQPVAELRVNGRSLTPKLVDSHHYRLEGIALGPADRLEATWKSPTSSGQKRPPLLEAIGRIAVRVVESRISTDVDLQLQVQGGTVRQWRVQMPPQVIPEVKIQDDRLESFDGPDTANPMLVIRLKEPSAEPMRVLLQIREPRTPGIHAVGPFLVQDALRQRGTISIRAVADLRVRYQTHGDIMRREIPEDFRKDIPVAEFSYWNLAGTAPGKPAPAPLEMEVESIPGVVEARVDHQLTLIDMGWRSLSKIQITPVHARVDKLEIQVPADFQLDTGAGVTPADVVETVEIKEGGPARRIIVLKIREQNQPFALTIPGSYPQTAGASKRTLELAKPLQTQDRGGQAMVTLPEGLELSPGGPDDRLSPGERVHTWRWDRTPNKLELAWRPYRPEVGAKSVVDITLWKAQALVRQELRLQYPQAAPSIIPVTIPQEIQGRVRVEQGGTLNLNNSIAVAANSGKEIMLVLTYSFPLAPDATKFSAPREPPPAEPPLALGAPRFSVPFINATQVTRSDTKVRVWCDRPALPSLARGPWEEMPTETVTSHPNLPSLVLRSGVVEHPLEVRLSEVASPSLPALMIDQVLIQATVAENQAILYRARFMITRFNTRTVDLEFPRPFSGLNLEVFLGEKKLSRWLVIEEDKSAPTAKTIVRYDVEPSLYDRPIELEVRYQLALSGGSWPEPWLLMLFPPIIRGDVIWGRVGWQVRAPAGWISMLPGGGSGEFHWRGENGLLVPHPLSNDEMFVAGHTEKLNGNVADPEFSQQVTAFAWRTGLEPVSLVNCPGQSWLLFCSMLMVGFGLGLYYLNWPRERWWLVALLFVASVGGLGIWRSEIMVLVLYGCEPGILVIVVLGMLQWISHRRYRRRLIFLPGFTRLKTPSSLVRKEEPVPRRGEPLTVDAIPKRGSSVK